MLASRVSSSSSSTSPRAASPSSLIWQVFRAEGEITDSDIDTILANAKNLTAERSALQDKEKRNLLDFSDATTNFQEFEGVDYKNMAQHGDMAFMELMQARCCSPLHSSLSSSSS